MYLRTVVRVLVHCVINQGVRSEVERHYSAELGGEAKLPPCHTACTALAGAGANFDKVLKDAGGEQVFACAAEVDVVPQQLAMAIKQAIESEQAPAIARALTAREVGALLELPLPRNVLAWSLRGVQNQRRQGMTTVHRRRTAYIFYRGAFGPVIEEFWTPPYGGSFWPHVDPRTAFPTNPMQVDQMTAEQCKLTGQKLGRW